MDITILTLVFFGGLLVLMILGLPIAFCVGGSAMIFLIWQLGPNSLPLISITAWEAWTNYVLITIPLFVLMALFLERSGMADNLYETMYRWMGPLRGGLAMGTVAINSVFAAMTGGSALGVISMGLVALPSMIKRGYDKSVAIGCVLGGGALGILIPPSIPMIVYAFLAEESVGALFMGGVFPGLLMALIFMLYIGIRCGFRPQLGPALPKEERFTWQQKIATTKSFVLPIILIVAVLGFIYLGVTTPTEAAGIGAFGALICVFIYRAFSWKLLHSSLMGTLRVTAMAGWTIFGAMLFTHVYSAMGANQFVSEIITSLEVNRWIILVGSQAILIFLGCFMDPFGIIIICVPIFVPIMQELGFDLVWFGILFTMNLEIGFLTPPFGVNLFFMKVIAPKNVTMGDIYKSVTPFVLLMMFAMALVILFPQIALWLPEMMIRGR